MTDAQIHTFGGNEVCDLMGPSPSTGLPNAMQIAGEYTITNVVLYHLVWNHSEAGVSRGVVWGVPTVTDNPMSVIR